MPCSLILIRHAKSDWDDPMMDDHDRPLNPRGRSSAPRLGFWLNAQGLLPDAVLCSTATRTRETWDGIATQLPGAPSPIFSRGLYHAAPEELLNAIQDTNATCVAVVAHNPGIGSLAWALCDSPPDHPKFGLYPTGATLVLTFDSKNTQGITPGSGRVRGFVVPRDLPDPT